MLYFILLLEKSIFILQMKAWCDTAEQYPTGEALLSLCGAVDDILKKTDGSKKICVTCFKFDTSTNKNIVCIKYYSFGSGHSNEIKFMLQEDYQFIYQVLKTTLTPLLNMPTLIRFAESWL
ncbi:hypothetical protein EB796_012501 [Bugula neritina]|uniref:Uncharacterized protein n=1 Tax=Bugula neritina TaxID=10212 RepID=A0A7J7JS71_BUGNE|nr:hypothetical protein EB796_012501 [Bugula neritina]